MFSEWVLIFMLGERHDMAVVLSPDSIIVLSKLLKETVLRRYP